MLAGYTGRSLISRMWPTFFKLKVDMGIREGRSDWGHKVEEKTSFSQYHQCQYSHNASMVNHILLSLANFPS